MNIPNVMGLVKVGKTFLVANRPEILLGTAITATVSAVIMAAKGGYQARGLVLDAEMDRPDEPLTTKEKVKLTWLCYLPAGITTLGALGSLSGLHFVHVKEKKALVTASLAAIEEIKAEGKSYADGLLATLNEEVPEDQKRRVQDQMNARGGAPSWITDGDGEIEEIYLVRDAWTGRDIYSNKRRIEEALNELNGVINSSGDVDLNTFYTYAGFGTIPQGEILGWGGETLVTIKWDTTVRDDDRPVKVFTFRTQPKEGYSDPHR